MENFSSKKLGNRYNLLEKVGDGGMALVYKARCELLNRNVAVKVLRPEFMADEDFVKKFKSESQAVASLSHPNIVNVYDVGNEDGISYIVMEFVEGINLKDYIKKYGKLEYKEALKIVKQIAKALENAHKNGVIHRDIKPHNILITEEGIVKVADFGIARAATSSTMTNTKSVMGSVHYVSPEQAKGSLIDNKTDIYSLGIVMYELLTGSVPFDGESPISVAIKHIQDEIKVPPEIKDSIPESVWDIIFKSTQKDPLKRYQTLTDMIDDINAVEKNPNSKIGLSGDIDESTRIIPIEEIEKAMQERTAKINKDDYEEIEDDFDSYEDDDFDDYEEDEYEVERKKKIKKGSAAKKGKKKKLMVSTLIALAVFILVGGGALAFLTDIAPKEFTIPKLVGLTEADATQALAAGKIVVEVKKVKSDKPEGEVVQVYPAEGMKVKEKSTVTLSISEGKQMVRMPSLRNMTLEEAESELTSLGLVIGDTKRKYSSSVDKDRIISQSIDSNEEVEEGSKVDIVISSGEEIKLSKVPSLIGKTVDEIKSLLRSVGLNLGGVKYESNPNHPDGVVIRQGVSEGSSIKEGSSVSVVVNKIEQVETPNENKENTNNGNNGNDNNKPKKPNRPDNNGSDNGGSSENQESEATRDRETND